QHDVDRTYERRIARRLSLHREVAKRTDDTQAVASNRVAVRPARHEADLMALPRKQCPIETADGAGADDRNLHGNDCTCAGSPQTHTEITKWVWGKPNHLCDLRTSQ